MVSLIFNRLTSMSSNRPPQRTYSDEFKAKVLAQCDEPGAQISRVAFAHGLDANLVRKWRNGHGFKHPGLQAKAAANLAVTSPSPPSASPWSTAAPDFVAINMPTPLQPTANKSIVDETHALNTQPHIHVDLHCGQLLLNVRWPTSSANDCAAWLRDLGTGLLK